MIPFRAPLCSLAILALVPWSCGFAQESTFGFDGNINKTTGLPEPWKPLKHPLEDWPAWTVVKDNNKQPAIQGKSVGGSGGLMRSADQVDLRRTPWMHFSWKVDKHPRGTVADRSRSDQAMIIYVDFGKPKSGFFSRRREVAYVYDSSAKVGSWHDDSTLRANVWAKVVDSGTDELGRWKTHAVNVAEDFRERFGGDLEPVQGIAIYCNSNNSDSDSLGCCSRLRFRETAGSAGK